MHQNKTNRKQKSFNKLWKFLFQHFCIGVTKDNFFYRVSFISDANRNCSAQPHLWANINWYIFCLLKHTKKLSIKNTIFLYKLWTVFRFMTRLQKPKEKYSYFSSQKVCRQYFHHVFFTFNYFFLCLASSYTKQLEKQYVTVTMAAHTPKDKTFYSILPYWQYQIF